MSHEPSPQEAAQSHACLLALRAEGVALRAGWLP